MDSVFVINCLSLFLLTFISVYFSKKILQRYQFFDYVNARSSHILTKTRGGGISFLTTGSLYFFSQGLYYPLTCIIFGILGFLDDKFKYTVKTRFIFQLLFSFFLIYNSPFYELTTSQFNSLIFEIFIIITFLIFSTGLINFINFMDGIDGLVCSSFIPWLIVLGQLTSSNVYLGFSFCLIAFLIWNWQPAKIFMGDVGSLYLGSLLSASLFQMTSYSNFFILLMVISPLILDPLTCLFMRYIYRHNIFSGHKLHLY